MPEDLSKTRHVQSQDPLSSELLAQPTRSLEYRLALLEAELRQGAAATNTRVIIPNVPLDTQVRLRNTVFFNQATNKYERALAGAVYKSGAYENIAASMAVGVVVRINGTVGDVMVGGFDAWKDSDRGSNVDARMLETGLTFKSGVPYFLSASEPGKLTNVPPAYRVQVLVATDRHFVLLPAYSTLDSFEDNFPVPLGLRPVGSLRSIAPSHQQTVIVGFDGLELDATTNEWTSTAQGIAPHATNGWVIADATIDKKPVASFFIRIAVAAGGLVSVKQSATLALLSDGGAGHAPQLDSFTLTDGNSSTILSISLVDQQNLNVGTLRFRFTSGDSAKARRLVLQVPESFQGWKMVNAPKRPTAKLVAAAGKISRVDIIDPGVGFVLPPHVSVAVGSGSTLIPVLDENGGVLRIDVTNTVDGVDGINYVNNAEVLFDSRVASTRILNGGNAATFTLTTETVGSVAGVITSVAVANGGANYWLPPVLELLDPSAAGTGAQLRAVVEQGAVVRVDVVNGGANYSSSSTVKALPAYYGYQTNQVGVLALMLKVANGGTTQPGTLTPSVSSMRLAGVHVDCRGLAYTSGTIITVDPAPSGGISAQVKAVLGTLGDVLRVEVTNHGAGYLVAPTLSVSGGIGHGAKLTALMEADVPSIGIGSTGIALGTSFTRQPRIDVGVPVRDTQLDDGGSGYASNQFTVTVAGGVGNAMNVGVSVPDMSDGAQATVRAYKGGKVISVEVTSGSGYSTPSAAAVQFDIGGVLPGTPDNGSALVQLQPLFLDGQLISVEILRAGHGLLPLRRYVQEAVTNVGAAFTLATHGLRVGQRVSFENVVAGLTEGATYYVLTAATNTFTVEATLGGGVVTPSGNSSSWLLTSLDTYRGTISEGGVSAAGASCEIKVGAEDAVVELFTTSKGSGYTRPPRITITAPAAGDEPAQAHANLQGMGLLVEATMSGLGGRWNTDPLQVSSWSADFDDGAVAYARPRNCGFYYNTKADPSFRERWPSRPLEKCVIIANGVELRAAVVNPASGVLEGNADLGLLTKTIAWRGLAREGAPWDSAYQSLVNDYNGEGVDAIYQPTSGTDGGWRWWERLYKNEGNLSRATVHVNKTSRFYQSGRVQSLTALAPLKLVDTLVGLDNVERPGPMTGQLTIMLDTEENLLSPWSSQIDLTQSGSRTAIYQNSTGRPVFLKSVQIRSVFQTNQSGVPTAADAALVTVGTAAGNYRNIIGTLDPALATTPGVSVRLFAGNQIKELFPDATSASPVIFPNETVYLQVDVPASGPVVTQLTIVRIMGHAL